MKKYATDNGMQTLKEAAMSLLKNGFTTIDEVIDIVHGL
jgi:type II secretory ATPase GspE/PulE/Tfp pilus assembly ATPase PilB-like protein